jgi:hypothetical protein
VCAFRALSSWPRRSAVNKKLQLDAEKKGRKKFLGIF